jgi:hypothetical protein
MQRGIFGSKKTLAKISEFRVEILNMEIKKKKKKIQEFIMRPFLW